MVKQSSSINDTESFLYSLSSSNSTAPCTRSILLINARSLLPKIHHLQSASTVLNPTFICVTETWLSNAVVDASIALPGYTIFRKDRSSTQGGGCIIYVKNTVQASEVDLPSASSIGDNTDSIWVCTSQSASCLLLGCVYNPPPCSTRTISNLCDLFSRVQSLEYDTKVIVGDFNLPEVNWDTQNTKQIDQPRYTELKAILNSNGWVQQVQQPTRGVHLLDLIFTAGSIHSQVEVGPLFPESDHKMVYAALEMHTPPTENDPRTLQSRLLSPEILSAISDIIRVTDWTPFFITKDPQAMCNIFYETILELLHLLAPAKKRAIRKHVTDTELKVNTLRRRYLQRSDLSSLLQIIKLAQETNCKRTLMEREQERRALGSHNKSASTSSLFRKRCPRVKLQITNVSTSDGKILIHPEEISEHFNIFFSNCYNPPLTNRIPLPELTVANGQSLSTILFNLADIAKLLGRIKDSSTPGSDGLPPTLLKHGGSDIQLLIYNLFTILLSSGHFPSQWKQSIIIPRYKSGCRTAISNYRGIHNTALLARTLERVIKPPLVAHLLENNHISDRQYGFLSKRSVASCQVHFLSLIKEAQNMGKCIVVLYLDIKKAFDQVPHHNMLCKLKNAGISGPLLQWFLSYFEDRLQVTSIDGYLSTPLKITSGVIQGSVLGPVLFLLYINDITEYINHGKFFLFADDLKIVYTFTPNLADLMFRNIQYDLDSVVRWTTISGLKFSSDKCQILFNHCPPTTASFTLDGNLITNAITVTDLGLRYSCNFNFTNHVMYQVAKSRRLSYLIIRNFYLTPIKVVLFKQHVRPLLEYCSTLSSMYGRQLISAIENVQRRFTKMLLPRQHSATYRERCAEFGLEPLWLRRLRLNLLFFHKLVYNAAYIDEVRPVFKKKSHYNLRNSMHCVQYPRSHLSSHQNFFLNKYSWIWNKLPESWRSISNTASFAYHIHNHLDLNMVATVFSCQDTPDQLSELGLLHI